MQIMTQSVPPQVAQKAQDLSESARKAMVKCYMNLLAPTNQQDKKITTLYLSSKDIGAEQAKIIAESLKDNKIIDTLYLMNNKLGPEGAKYIAEMLRTNTTLKTVGLYGNRIMDEGAKALAEALKDNKTLEKLWLGYNEITNAGFLFFEDAKENNAHLAKMQISFMENSIRRIALRKELEERRRRKNGELPQPQRCEINPIPKSVAQAPKEESPKTENSSEEPPKKKKRTEDTQKKMILAQTKTVFVDNLSIAPEATEKDLEFLFRTYGKVVSSKVFRNEATNASMGCGTVTFEEVSCAQNAIKQLSSVGKIKDKRIIVVDAHYQPQVGYKPENEETALRSLLIRPLTPSVTDENIIEVFQEGDKLEFARIVKDQEKSLGFAFCVFKTYQDAEAARKRTNGSLLRKTKLLVDFCNTPQIDIQS